MGCDSRIMRTNKSSLVVFAKPHSLRIRRNGVVDRRLIEAVSEEEFVADPVTSRRAAVTAVRAAERVSRNSRIIDPAKVDAIPRFSPSELSLGALLGKGGFSDVYEISSFALSGEDAAGCHEIAELCEKSNDRNLEQIELKTSTEKNEEKSEEEYCLFERMQRSFIAEHCVREKTGIARYAIKHLSESCLADGKQFQTGAADLAVEAKFLSSLEYPNIIKLRGLASSGPEGFAKGTGSGFFLVLDRLYGTLAEKLQDWSQKRQKSKLSNFIRRGILDRKSTKQRQDAFTIRMEVALDIAGGLAYLHSQNIIYRDLKPDNIGFDIRGDIKIFDFGLSKELNGECNADNTYTMTGLTGSLRYMAPETVRCQDYNLSADVYSHAILLWQILSLDKPYDGMDTRMHSDEVVYGLTRPEIDPSWSEPLCKVVLKNGWHPNLHKRPRMNQVYQVILTEVARLSGGDEISLGQRRQRRSTYVMGRQSINATCD